MKQNVCYHRIDMKTQLCTCSPALTKLPKKAPSSQVCVQLESQVNINEPEKFDQHQRRLRFRATGTWALKLFTGTGLYGRGRMGGSCIGRYG